MPRASSLLRFGSLDRVLAGAILTRDPAKVGELLERGFAAEASPATVLNTAERHRWFVVHSGVVDMADAGLQAPSDLHRCIDIGAEHRGREAVLGVVGNVHRLLDVVYRHDRDHRPK